MRCFFGKEKEKDVNMEKLQKEGKDIRRKTNRKIFKNKRKDKKRARSTLRAQQI